MTSPAAISSGPVLGSSGSDAIRGILVGELAPSTAQIRSPLPGQPARSGQAFK